MPRRKPKLNYKLIEKLAKLGCTEYEIAFAIGYTPTHFSLLKSKDKKIEEAIGKGSNHIKISIRRAQLKVALPTKTSPGNVTMLIWLGKQYLRQSDHLKLSGDEENPLNANINIDISDIDKRIDRYLKQRKDKALNSAPSGTPTALE